MNNNNRTYTILEIGSLSAITFSEVLETSASTVRKNNDGSEFVIKFEFEEPECLIPLTKISYYGRDFHNQSETLEIMSITGTTGWMTNEEI